MKASRLTATAVALAMAWVTTVNAQEEPTRPATLDLDTVLSLALENNYAIRQARARYAEATGIVLTAKSGRLPVVSVDANYSEVDNGLLEAPGGQIAGDNRSWDAGISARQLLYAGGAVSSSIKAGVAGQSAAAADFDASVQTALLGVREAFYTVLLARQQVSVQEEALKLLEEELANADARVRAGSGSPFERLRAEVAVANGRPPLIRARNDYRLAAVELLRAVGLSSDDSVADTVVGELTFVAQEFSMETLLGSAHARRPELRQLEHLVLAAENSVDTARAGRKPSVAAVAGYGIQKSRYYDSLDATVDGWNLGVQASWAIFDGHATRGQVMQARSRLEQAKLQLDEVTLIIDTEVRQAYLNYLGAAELVTASQKVVEQALESVRLARSRYNAGASTQLDVLQTQVALTEARTNEAQALYGANVAYARLSRAAALADLPAGLQALDAPKP